MRHSRLEHRFVKHLPDALEPGILYISVEYGTAGHLCCCGCGEEVVTPLTPTDWLIIFNGETVSLKPSVGNWTLACRSHYVIQAGRVIEAPPWTDKQVAAERARDRNAKAIHFGAPSPSTGPVSPAPLQAPTSAPGPESMWSRISRWLLGR